MDNSDKKDNKEEKVKVELRKSVVDKLFQLKNRGDTYSDVIEGLFEK